MFSFFPFFFRAILCNPLGWLCVWKACLAWFGCLQDPKVKCFGFLPHNWPIRYLIQLAVEQSETLKMKTQLQLKNLSNGTENFIKRKEKKRKVHLIAFGQKWELHCLQTEIKYSPTFKASLPLGSSCQATDCILTASYLFHKNDTWCIWWLDDFV